MKVVMRALLGIQVTSSFESMIRILSKYKIIVRDKGTRNLSPTTHRSKQLIKDAILDNDFLKHLDCVQIRELVESMYSRDVSYGEYVIREKMPGNHLYVSDAGEFEIEVGGKVLGTLSAGKAFGELAILYNCRRTASIKCRLHFFRERVREKGNFSSLKFHFYFSNKSQFPCMGSR